MKSRQLLLVIAAVLALATPLSAEAQEYPPNAGEVTLRDSSGNTTTSFEPGETGEITASDMEPDTTYDVMLSQSPAEQIGGGRSNADGFLRATFRIPGDAEPGPATLTLDPRGMDGGSRNVAIRIIDVEVKSQESPNRSALGMYLGVGGAVLVVALIAWILWRRQMRPGPAEDADREQVPTG